MKKTEIPFFLGYVEQGVGGGQDPLSPPISISRNGTLAKWRDKLHFVDLRVNDPGLKKNRAAFVESLEKTAALGLKTIITLPEYSPVFFELPPEPPLKPDEVKTPPRRGAAVKPEKLVYFKPAYLALPSSIQGNTAYHNLTVAECLPIIDLAAEHGVDKVIVPVSEPGMFLDPQAEVRFKKAFKELHAAAVARNVTLHVRNGGISAPVYKKLAKEFACSMAYDIGIGHLEGDDILATYQNFADQISVLILQQVLPGLDKWGARRDSMERSLKNYVLAKKEYQQSLADDDTHYTEGCLKRFAGALKDYYDAYRNTFYNLGLFQNGDINVVPLLKELRRDLEAGHEKYLLLSMVPNTKNNDFVVRNIMPDNFDGKI